MLDQKIFGEKLRNHRKKLGMTQEEVAESTWEQHYLKGILIGLAVVAGLLYLYSR